MSDSTHPNRKVLSRANFQVKQFVRASAETKPPAQSSVAGAFNLDGKEVKKFYDSVVESDSEDEIVVVSETKARNADQTSKKMKLEKKDEPNQEYRVSDMFRAAESDNVDLLRACLASLDPNTVDPYEWTPLMTAACAGSADCVRFLLERTSANPTLFDKGGNSALSLAQQKNFDAISRMIRRAIKGKAIVNIKKSEAVPVIELQEDFFCESCQTSFKDCSRAEHLSSTLHIFNTDKSEPKTIYGISQANRGFQMMLQTGWNQNKGLGPDGKGKKFPVKTVLKRDRQGIGVDGANVARVTHFGPMDTTSVELPKRTERATTLNKRLEKRQRLKAKRKERKFRNELSGL